MTAPQTAPSPALAPEWVDDAACLTADPELWYIDKGGSADPALRVCASCPVLDACFEYAVDTAERFGVWGGMTERQRDRYRRGDDETRRRMLARRDRELERFRNPDATPDVVAPADAPRCPNGHPLEAGNQVRNGHTPDGRQRWRCRACRLGQYRLLLRL